MITSKPERREAALINVELRNFTRLSEMLPPEKVLDLANEFFSLCA
ncbi:MAG: adenylate/guanylate cyclase domain-containing response regulator, partial [Betaproteobacteria bacterium]|nr:adenylate/guanylate cyclase domain-containing response regulator [Betaproteobacteria bacterium]